MSDTEKVSFNVSIVNLGQVDFLIDQGFYSSRTDFLVAAVRNLLESHASVVEQAVAQREMKVGVAVYARRDLEHAVAEGKQLEIKVVGVLVIADDVTPELASAAIKSVTVFGKLRASSYVKAALLFRKRPE